MKSLGNSSKKSAEYSGGGTVCSNMLCCHYAVQDTLSGSCGQSVYTFWQPVCNFVRAAVRRMAGRTCRGNWYGPVRRDDRIRLGDGENGNFEVWYRNRSRHYSLLWQKAPR